MTFRYARHSSNLDRVKSFYVDCLGFDVIGSFENHDNYDGLFLGKKGESWHLEFTVSQEPANHTPDEDDLLVFYLESKEELILCKDRLKQNGIQPVKAKNPYWNKNGISIIDPDGFRVVLTVKAI